VNRPATRLIAALVAVVLTGAACSALPSGASPSPVGGETTAPTGVSATSPTETDGPGSLPTPETPFPESDPPAPTIDTCCVASPTPIPDESLEESNAFWDYWADPPRGFVVREASSLQENIDIAHLIVRGHITAAYVGEYWHSTRDAEGGTPLGYVTIAVSEVLKGTPVQRTPGYVEVGLGSTDLAMIEDLNGRLPQHDNVWFLVRDVDLEPRSPTNDSEIAEFAYLPTNDLQGLLRDIGGTVRMIKPEWAEENIAGEHFPLPLEGSPFAALLESIRQVQ
jgi:hypothetical protein